MDSVGAAYYLPGINHKNMMPEAVLNNSSVDQIGDNINIRHQERPRISSFSHSISCSPISKSLREPMTLNSSNDKSIRFYQSNSIAGSIPISELVRMLEDEMHISRDDKLALNSALLDPERQDIVIITLRDIELSSNIRFAVRRLKMLIHQNPAGMPADGRSNFQLSISTSNLATPLNSISPPIAKSSSSAVRLFDSHQNHRYKLESFSPLCADAEGSTPYSVRSTEIRGGDYSKKRPGSCDEYAEEITSNGASDTVGVILTSVGDSPAYSDPNCSGMCSKISRRLIEYNGEEKNAQKRMRPAKFAVLVGSGSCNPLTRMHMRSFFLAKQHLERIVGFVVLGSILSPSHGVSVRERYRNHPAEVIPSPHRLAVAQLMVAGSKWLSVDPWEITRRRTMDYMSLLQHCRAILTEQFPDEEIKIIYLCKENMVPKISPAAMRQQNFGCISVCRPIECDRIKSTLTSKWNGTLWVAEDSAIVDTSMDVVTSRDVRQKLKENQPVKHLVGGLIDEYFKKHLIGAKMNGHSEWIPNELHLPPILSRSIKPTKITLSDLNCNNLSKAVCEAPLPSDLADRSNSNPLTQYPYNNNQDALPFSQDSLLGSPQIAPQISINKSVNSVFSPAKDSIKFRPKVKHRRLATIVSSVARHGEY